jgi:hypothetical protein
MDGTKSNIRHSQVSTTVYNSEKITKEKIMTSKNGKTETLTAQLLAEELLIDANDLIPLLSKMGIKNAKEDSIVSEAIARNARLAVAAIKARSSVGDAMPALSAGKEVDPGRESEVSSNTQESVNAPKEQSGSGEIQIHQKLKLAEIKDVAAATGLSQTIIKKFDQALHDRECQIAFLEGFQRSQRQKELFAARETGQIAAELQEIQRREKELSDREDLLVEQGTSTANHPVELAKALGIDIDAILGQLEVQEQQKAEQRLNQNTVEDESLDPFQRLAARKKQQG